jgi:exosortase A-associated hydrolase 2
VSFEVQRFFLERKGGAARFCTLLTPVNRQTRGGLLLLAPFAEEANKTRRLCLETARACAAAGWAVLLGDLTACGESEGDFSNTSWPDWLADVADFAGLLREKSDGPQILLGLRLGALLAANAIANGLKVDGLFFLCPITNGKQALMQFLRLGAAADLNSSETARIDTRPLRAKLAAGENVEIAGYSLSPALAAGMEAAQVTADMSLPARLAWLEVVSSDPPAVTPAVEALTNRLREAGHSLDIRLHRGPAFWQTQEIEHLPELPKEIVALLEKLAEGTA